MSIERQGDAYQSKRLINVTADITASAVKGVEQRPSCTGA